MNKSRRDFIRKAVAGSAAVTLGQFLPAFSAKSYNRIIGSNSRVNLAVMGVNSRGYALGTNFAGLKELFEVMYACEVDSRAEAKFINAIEPIQNRKPVTQQDFRKALEDKNLDALVIAAPDHWHAPAAILACAAGKHVYVEKPCSHNPHEGELLVKAARRYNRVVQMGNQRRSWPNVVAAINEVHSGTIGNVYFAKTWYSADRGSIGKGKPAAVPDWLNYELWQGPAPRRPFMDNVIHYNWHWFWHWGTGEALNNGTHTVDLARWGLQVDYPTRVSSFGGRYFFDDDWETPDTQTINLEFGNRKLISWESRSCNGAHPEGDEVGVIFYGDKGSVRIGSGNTYQVFDMKNKLIKDVKNDVEIQQGSKISPSQMLDTYHLKNFYEGIRDGKKLSSEIGEGYKSTLLVQLGNISWRTKHTLDIDSANGHILNDKKAQRLWQREYQKGWEPKV